MRPEKLFIAIDGPRKDRPQDIELCKQTRDVAQEVDWPCEVQTLFRETNHGCLMHIAPALDWFFKNVEAGIVFEDDCIPNQTFFPYCRELLLKYKDDPHIMHISGNNFQHHNPKFQLTDSYYFSRIPHCWGWATWRRAWNLYDGDLKLLPAVKAEKKLQNIFRDDAVAHRWEYLFDQARFDVKHVGMTAKVDWDGRWAFSCLAHEGLCIMPRVNLVSNIGFNDQARVARNPNDQLANLPTHPIEIPLRHPEHPDVHQAADRYTYKHILGVNKYLSQRIRWFAKSKFNTPYQLVKPLYRSLRK